MAKKKSSIVAPPAPAPVKGTRSPRSPFAIGDKVKYIGTDRSLVRQYAGELEVWEFGVKVDRDRCTCLKPNGCTTSWIEYEELTLVKKYVELNTQ